MKTRCLNLSLSGGLALLLVSYAALKADAAEFRPTAQNKFVSPGSKMEMLWDQGEFTEGPALAPDGSILFSDIGNTIYRFNPKNGQTTIFREKSGRANGLMFDQQGRLIACEGANVGGLRRISVTDKNGEVRTLADRYQGKKFNSPNDLAIDAKGRVYFSDPRYVGDEPRELDIEVVFLVTPDGKVKIAAPDATKPNGILISPDNRRVYLSDNDGKPNGSRQLVVYQVQKDGTLAHRKVLHDFGEGRGIDGMTLDVEGNIYATAGREDKSGVYVFSPSGGHLAFIPTPGAPTNCVFGGGGEATTLYITAAAASDKKRGERTYALYRIRLAKKGHHIVRYIVPLQ